MNVTFQIDEETFSYSLEGDFFWGEDTVLFSQNESLIDRCSWKDTGYTVLPLPAPGLLTQLQADIRRIVHQICSEAKIPLPDSFALEDYHQFVTTADQHQAVISQTRWLTRHDFTIDWASFCTYVSDTLGYPVGLDNPLLEREIIILRISRPQSMDINPLHRDGHLDIWKNTLNLWIPIAGCTHLSSLPVLPGSHLWNEKDILRTATKGATLNGLPYHVPAIARANHPLRMIRPNPKPGEMLVFTPFLIHGSAFNQHNTVTRFSLELRLQDYRKSDREK